MERDRQLIPRLQVMPYAQVPAISAETTCRACGQSLEGLDIRSSCERCGTPVRLSLYPRLNLADPAYLATLRRAVNFLGFGAITFIGAFIINWGTRWFDPRDSRRAYGLILLLTGASVALQTLGGWWLTFDDPDGLVARDRRILRAFIRLGAIGGLIGFILELKNYPIPVRGLMVVQMWIRFFSVTSSQLAGICVLIFLQWVAVSVPNRGLVKQGRWLTFIFIALYSSMFAIGFTSRFRYIVYVHSLYQIRSLLMSAQLAASFVLAALAVWLAAYFGQFHRVLLRLPVHSQELARSVI